MLNLNLQLQDLIFLEALKEILPQAGISVKEELSECDGILSISSPSGSSLPFLNFSTLSRPLRFFDLLSLLKNLP